jgi:hypothetical protein
LHIVGRRLDRVVQLLACIVELFHHGLLGIRANLRAQRA